MSNDDNLLKLDALRSPDILAFLRQADRVYIRYLTAKRDAALARAEVAEAEVKRLRDMLQGLLYVVDETCSVTCINWLNGQPEIIAARAELQDKGNTND